MKCVQVLEKRLSTEKFDPSWLGVFINPFYIARKGLIDAIRGSAAQYGGEILDFGCGSKPYQTLFVNSRRYVGVDIEISGHSHLNSQIDYFYDGVTLPFVDTSFDHVVSFEVFEHIFNLDHILDEIYRVLRPGGDLLFSIPFAWHEHEQPYDFGRYTSFGITTIIERSGLKIVEMIKTSGDIEAIVQLFTSYLYQNMTPKNKILKGAFQVGVIAPITLIGLAAGKILPRPGEIYTDLVIRARKSSEFD